VKHNPNCELCQNNRPFEIPPDLYNALKRGKLVIFAGAGISTESSNVYTYSLNDELINDLGYSPEIAKLALPDLVSLFENQDNGRRKLLMKIRGRIQYVKSFKKLFNAATSFHQELADIHQISEIVTTNWDDFFEQVCDAVPFVIPKDFTFWELPERRVLKIHGSINNLNTIVASRTDYNKCQENLAQGLIGSFLKTILATKTIVYCGYSLNDSDFQQIQETLSKEMGQFMPHAYFVTINPCIRDKIDTSKITPIVTDATYFMHGLKKKLISDKIMNDPSIYNDVESELDILHRIHTKLLCRYDLEINPIIIYTYSFQDGISDALEHGLFNRRTGKYLCPTFIGNRINNYENILKRKEKIGKYWDVAYIDGYIYGLSFFIVPKSVRSKMPLYYILGYDEDIYDKKDFDRLLKNKEIYNIKAHKAAVNIYKRELKDKDLIPHHTPFLL
jgi:NAD-dependent SIR2 family protein deacetylase